VLPIEMEQVWSRIVLLVYGRLLDLHVGLHQASTSQNVPHPSLAILIIKTLMFAATQRWG